MSHLVLRAAVVMVLMAVFYICVVGGGYLVYQRRAREHAEFARQMRAARRAHEEDEIAS